jgi:hypothetical protein
LLGWKTVVRIGAINCYAEENNAVCEQHNIMAYPTLRVNKMRKYVILLSL